MPKTCGAIVVELRRICAETYQVLGAICAETGIDATKAMDNLSAMRLVHEDVLPFHPRRSVNALPALIEFAQRTEPLIIAAMNGALDGPEDVEVEMAVEAWKRLLEALK